MTAPVQLALPGRRFKPKKPPPALETHTQIALADFMRLALRRDVRWTHIASGGYRTPATARLLKRMGVMPGWPDFALLDKCGVAFIEMKRGARGALSPEQAAFMSFCIEAGIRYGLCRSFGEAEAKLAEWGMLKGRVTA